MWHPLFSAALRHPDLLAEHAANYGALVREELATATHGVVARLIAGAVAAVSALTALCLTGTAIMLGVLGLTWFLRPMLRRKAQAKGLIAEAGIAMKTLASLPLASRQKVQLIQVGDEKILIGVTPENVTFLTAIGRHQAAMASVPAFAQPNNFARMLTERPAADKRPIPPPVLKNVEGNDPETLAATRVPSTPAAPTALAAAAQATTAPKGQRINVSVGEDGIKSVSAPLNTKAPKPKTTDTASEGGEGGQKAIDDVTRMIREKLKTLRTI